MKTQFSKKELIEDKYIIDLHSEFSKLEESYKSTLRSIRKIQKLLEERKMEIMEFGQ